MTSQSKKLADKEWYRKNSERVKAGIRRQRELKPDARKQWYANNRDRELAKTRAWREENKEHLRKLKQEWGQKNLHKIVATNAKRHAAKLQRTPKWLTVEHLEQIESFYARARELTIQTGVIHVVDHIHPLQGKTLSGLHVPWNLQVITAEQNLQKGNKLLSDSL